MAQDSVVCTIASVQFPGVYLQLNSAGHLGIGHGGGPLDQFRISPAPDKGDYVTSFESVAYPGVHIQMDGTDELFIIRRQSDDTVAIQAQANENAYLRLAMGKTGVVINCESEPGPLPTFRLEPAPAALKLRVLSYNTHLMQLSYIESATDTLRKINPTPYAVWQDEARRDVIITNVINSRADIVSFQEVWAPPFEDYVRSALYKEYPFFLDGDTKSIIFGTSTSGLMLFSKLPLSDRFFERFPGMSGMDDYSNKGVLCCWAEIPNGGGLLRIGTGHTTGAISDIQWIADKTVAQSAPGRALPAIMMGDFNISWKSGSGNQEYEAMRKIFSFPDKGIMPARDAWIEVHGEGTSPDPYTVIMRDNKLHQLFSPERDTEPDTRLDYLWVKPGEYQSWTPIDASVPRDSDWTYSSPHWHWAHNNFAVQMPSAAILNDRLVVVTKQDGETVTENARVTWSILDRNTRLWRHGLAELFTSACPSIVAFEGELHLFYRHHGGNAILHQHSDNGEVWKEEVYTGFDTGGSVCAIDYHGKLYLFFVDPDGLGGMVYCTTRTGSGYGRGNWTPRVPLGITTLENISATVFNKWLVVVTKDNSAFQDSSGVMCAILKGEGKGWEWHHPDDLETLGSPGAIAMEDGSMHVYYRHSDGNALYRAIYDGATWEIDQNTGHEEMRGGACPVFFDDKLWVFYPYFNFDPGHAYYRNFTLLHTQIPDPQVDVSDHYPLMVDLKQVLIKVAVRIMDIGEKIFGDEQWAGTRGKTKALEGFQLTSRITGVTLKYMAHIQDHGDSDWKTDGVWVGESGKRIEGFRIRMEGDAASAYELTYRAHLSGTGDTDFFTEGEYCGTTGEKRAVEAMWLQIKRK